MAQSSGGRVQAAAGEDAPMKQRTTEELRAALALVPPGGVLPCTYDEMKRLRLAATEPPQQFVYVVFGVYSDRSSAKLLGVYSQMAAAEDRVKMLREGESIYQVQFAKVPLNKTFGVELRP